MWLPLWALWSIAILLVGILPLDNFVGHSHWEHLDWIPTRAQLHSPGFYFDLVANVLLFLPFGLLGGRHLAGAKTSGPLRLLPLALLLSCSIEFYQVYCHDRSPSPVDVASNACGAAAGWGLGRRRRRGTRSSA